MYNTRHAGPDLLYVIAPLAHPSAACSAARSAPSQNCGHKPPHPSEHVTCSGTQHPARLPDTDRMPCRLTTTCYMTPGALLHLTRGNALKRMPVQGLPTDHFRGEGKNFSSGLRSAASRHALAVRPALYTPENTSETNWDMLHFLPRLPPLPGGPNRPPPGRLGSHDVMRGSRPSALPRKSNGMITCPDSCAHGRDPCISAFTDRREAFCVFHACRPHIVITNRLTCPGSACTAH